jgi:hypothetical protein
MATKTLKPNAARYMVLISGGGTVRVASSGHKADAAQFLDGMYGPDHKAEMLPMTQDAYADYGRRMGATFLHAALAKYPAPRGD